VAPIYRGRRVSSQQLPIKFRVVGWYECVSVVRRVIALHYEIELQLQPERDSLNHFSSYEAGSRFRCILRGVMVGLVLYLLRLTTHSNDYSCILKRNFVIMEEPELSHYVHTRVCTKMGKAQLQQRSGITLALLGFWETKARRGNEKNLGVTNKVAVEEPR
jgi:hypothetical protein